MFQVLAAGLLIALLFLLTALARNQIELRRALGDFMSAHNEFVGTQNKINRLNLETHQLLDSRLRILEPPEAHKAWERPVN